MGFWSTLFEVMAELDEESKEREAAEKRRLKKAGRCDGDCDNCPPHYGYRYGRWYYGKHHFDGCQRGGNSGNGGL